MSTKTTIKRVAIVAVTALGLGLMSVVSASANVTALTDASLALTPGYSDSSLQLVNTDATAKAQKYNLYTKNATVNLADLTVTVANTAGAGTDALKNFIAPGALTTGSAAQTPYFKATIDSSTGNAGYTLDSGTPSLVGGTPTGVTTSTLAASTSGNTYSYVAQLTANTLADPAAGDAVIQIVVIRTQFTLLTGTAVGDTTLTTVLPTTRAGVAGVYTLGFKASASLNEPSTTTSTIRAALTKPAGSAATVTLANNAATDNGFDTDMTVAGSGTNALTYTGDGTNAAVVSAADTLQVDATVNPDVVGTYSIMYYADLNNNSAIDSGEAYYSQSLSIVADAPVMTLTVWGSTTIAEAAGNDKGALVRIGLTNGGAATTLSGTEVINLSGIATFATGGNTSKTTVTRADFDKNGYAYVQAATATAGTYTLSAQGVGGGIAALLQTATITVKDATALDAGGTDITSFAKTNTTGVGTDTNNDTIKYLGTTTITYKATGATTAGLTTFEAGDVVTVRIADTDGLITGVAGLGYVSALTLDADAVATVSVTFASSSTKGTAPTAGNPDTVGTVTLDDTVDNVKTVRTALSLVKSFTVSPNSTIRTKTGGTITATALVKDQFGIAKSNEAVTATLAAGGRNSGVVVVQNLVTDASGYVSWTYTDAPLAANAALTSDVWAIASANQSATADGGAYAAGAVTVNWLTTLGVDKVAVTTPNTTAGVANDAEVVTDINSGLTGAQAGAISVTAKVTDASGSVLVGVPVTWTVSGTGAAFTSTTVTSYTGSTGIATGKLYGWVAGKYTVTATAEGKTSTGSVTFGQLTAAEARTISATAQGSLVTATVKDRFGNGVKDVTVYATRTSGDGYFGTGVTKTSGTTDANGQVEFIVAGSSSSVTVSLVSPSASAGTQFGQSAGAKGYDVAGADATAFTATAAGTSLKDETGVGASFDAAGVSSASVEATVSANSDAIDAANEATDAANAATDAANAAAEAADAATAAAQDAQAAVAELATQVAALIAGIKKQLTTLSNLIVKIQKKVRA